MESRKIRKFNGHTFEEVDDVIAIEYPLTIVVDGEEFATMVCTPDHLDELVIGFLASEGVIRLIEDIEALSIDEDRGFAYVELVQKQTFSKDFYSKRFIGACCGKSRQFYLHNDVKTAKTFMKNIEVSVSHCFALMKKMQEESTDFQLTGGLHNGSLCTNNQILLSRSDIGRHNVLDKIHGYCLKNKVSITDKMIAFSGRISSEVLLKVSKIGVGIILSKSAPTTLAINLANDLGITAIGFVRGQSLNVYSHPERIVL
ncbi:formate dehydrogenase accessory sulfurtransferase FdhD [Anaerobacillus alkaliphilus]|uniref:Sulfur carrier protein FdhD n=1 Tax=Anaerobacillus alkaliphilus TaxID=1548597 RepID=A0A4Q0VMV8_9BACI|nr:formate dehydrogenase accessory sulfurtransferase FdhD [Anaerobacillus alkaliphilus]RXI96737.1 formate dehydrogenase accessory sulfurtransferase FdhD [Anaerobacillus alkaliphilus]